MAEQVQTCPLCGGGASELFDRRIFRGQPVINRLCKGCGLVYQSPRMTDPELEAFYASEYRQVYQGTEGPTAKDLAVQSARAAALAGYLEQYVDRYERHLDVGCSAGILLETIHARDGGEMVGIEPGETYRAFAQERGIQVYPSLEAFEQAGEEHCDLITMAHVLEHLPDPVGYLSRLRDKFLSQEGWLLIEVPNLYAHDCFEIAHLVSFSEHTLRQSFARAGYEVRTLKAHGAPRSKLLPLYLTALAQPAGKHHWVNEVQPERGVELKRRSGMLRRQVIQRLFPRQAWIPF